jgi:prepilin-type N-terminal cleavage/methylation domain-containing protein
MKRQGFTLIELLAVIVILAVIAIMVTPMIVSTINSAKENAVKASARNYINGIEEYIAAENAKGNYITDNTYEVSYFSKVEATGQKPTSGTITIKNGQADSYTLVIGDYEITKNTGSDNLVIKEKGSSTTDVAITHPISIGELVLKKFPELELASGGGCKNPDPNKNYTYLGGCYLKGMSEDLKSKFYSDNLEANPDDGITKEMLDSSFVNGKFSIDKYNEVVFPIFAKYLGETTEQLNKKATDNGYSTFFEYNYGYSYAAFDFPLRDNNYVWFSGFVWRIMGINSDGNIRMITEENVAGIPWGAANSAQDYDNSYANSWVSSYFYSHINNANKSIIKPTAYCKNQTYDGGGYPYGVNTNRTDCTGGTQANAQATLLSLDEYNLAGGSSCYLFNGQWYSTLTPQSASDLWNVVSDDSTSYYAVTDASGLRPVITISSDATITGGDGTLSPTSNGYILNQTLDNVTNKKASEVVTSGEYVKYDGKTYRVVEKNTDGIKLILDEFYDSVDDGTSDDSIRYGTNFSTMGSKLSSSNFQKQLFNNDTALTHLQKNYSWDFGTDFKYGNDYATYLNSKSTKPFIGNVGLIKVGEMMSGQSLSVLTTNYQIMNDVANRWQRTYWYWILTSANPDAWFVDNKGYAAYYAVTNPGWIRPVIVITSDAEIIGGNGTLTAPFEVN